MRPTATIMRIVRLGVFALAFLMPTVPRAAVAAADLVIERAWVPAGVPEASLWMAEPQHRLLFAYNRNGTVLAFDLDTLERRGTLDVGSSLGVAASVDPDTGAIALAATDGFQTTAIVFVGFQHGQLSVVRRLAFSATSQAANDTVGAVPPGQTVVGMYLRPDSRFLYLLSDVADESTLGGLVRPDGLTRVTEIDLDAATIGVPTPITWSQALPSCLLPATNIDGVPAALGFAEGRRRALYFACRTYNGTVTGGLQGKGVDGIGVLELGEGGSRPFTLIPAAFSLSLSDVVYDDESDRLVILATLPGEGTAVRTFDARSERWVGAVDLGGLTLNSIGFNAAIGRLYAASADTERGLFVTDVRLTPPPQGRAYRRFPRSTPPSAVLYAVDSVTGRVFVPYAHDVLILHDSAPEPGGSPLPRPDDNTSDINEAPGRTAANFAASVQGFGARMRWVGGSNSLVHNVQPVDPTSLNPPLRDTRELRLAWIADGRVANGEAVAGAISADRDGSSTADQRAPGETPGQARRDAGNQLDAHVPEAGSAYSESSKTLFEGTASSPWHGLPTIDTGQWPYAKAACGDFGGSPKEMAVSGSAVQCNAEGAITTVSSSSPGVQLGGLSIGTTTTDATLTRDARGSVATITSIARNVAVELVDGSSLRIGSVASSTTVSAHGRSGTAAALAPRTAIENVVVTRPGQESQELCSQQCDLGELARTINSAFTSLLRVDFPTPDVLASPGGYQAVVRRDNAEHVEDIFLNGQPVDRVDVPAVVLTLSSDSKQPSRLLVEFAGVHADARYGIYSTGDALDLGPMAPLSPSGFLGGIVPIPVDHTVVKYSPGTVTTKTARGAIRRIVETVARAIKLLTTGDPRRLFVLWTMLLLPIYLAARRSVLLHRSAVLGGRSL
jgi:hypothetical protein